jgi:hypothetical protein
MLRASWDVEGREEKDRTEGLKTKYGEGQAADVDSATLRPGLEILSRIRHGHVWATRNTSLLLHFTLLL